MRRIFQVLALVTAIVFVASCSAGALEAEDFPKTGMVVLATPHGFGALADRLRAAISGNKMGLVTQASASAGAARRDVKIPGNLVLGVYRNDFAVRMLAASIPAGIEAPLCYYVTENKDGTATLSYQVPSATFAPYESADLDEMARELDVIFDKIARQAAGK